MQVEVRGDVTYISGYVNVVERFSKKIRENGRVFYEKINQGVFKRALKNNQNIDMLFNHNESLKLACTKDKSLSLYEDNVGLKVQAEIRNANIIRMAKAGELTGWSFGFQCLKDEWQEKEDGVYTRSIDELNLLEVSLLSVPPAYIGTLVEVRNNSAGAAEDGVHTCLRSFCLDSIKIHKNKTEFNNLDDDGYKLILNTLNKYKK